MNATQSNAARNQAANPALTAVPKPARKRGWMAAYNHMRSMPTTKSRTMDAGTSRVRWRSVIARLPAALQAAAIGAFRTAPYNNTSLMLSAAPVDRPEKTAQADQAADEHSWS